MVLRRSGETGKVIGEQQRVVGRTDVDVVVGERRVLGWTGDTIVDVDVVVEERRPILGRTGDKAVDVWMDVVVVV